MESAIAPHLTCPRSRERRIEDDYVPPYPAWVARAGPALSQVVMAYFGVQWRGDDKADLARQAFSTVTRSLERPDGPGHVDRAHHIDEAGYDNLIAIAYWPDVDAFSRWKDNAEVAGWWDSAERLAEGVGYFREVALPHVDRFETLLSKADRLEGVGAIMGDRSEHDIQEHGYWGSMRDRLPLSQTDAMKAAGDLKADSAGPALGHRIKVAGHANIALIRSGQEWIDTAGRERELYEKQMEPVLREGMDYLRDHGRDIGCYFNRYMRHVDAQGGAVEKSFGMSYWRSLSHMERWAEAHPTHVDIFGTFMRMVQELEFQLDLRLYHEVSVLAPDQQDYEYINCHPATGMLGALSA